MKSTYVMKMMGLLLVGTGIVFFQNCAKVGFAPNEATSTSQKGDVGSGDDEIVRIISSEEEEEANRPQLTEEEYKKCPQKQVVVHDIVSARFYAEVADDTAAPTINKYEHFLVDVGVVAEIKRTGCATHIMIRDVDFAKLDIIGYNVSHVWRLHKD